MVRDENIKSDSKCGKAYASFIDDEKASKFQWELENEN